MTVRRAFADTRAGQLHFRSKTGAAGNPLLLIHGGPAATAPLTLALDLIGASRPVYAVDLPGAGCSAPMGTSTPTMADFGAALADLVDALSADSIDVCGLAEGSCFAIELAFGWPGHVRRLAIEDPGAFLIGAPPPLSIDSEGGQFPRAWQRVYDGFLFAPWFRQDAAHQIARNIPSAEWLHAATIDQLRGVRTQHRILDAIAGYPVVERLQALSVPTLAPAELARLTPGGVIRDYALGDPGVLAGEGLEIAVRELTAFLDGARS